MSYDLVRFEGETLYVSNTRSGGLTSRGSHLTRIVVGSVTIRIEFSNSIIVKAIAGIRDHKTVVWCLYKAKWQTHCAGVHGGDVHYTVCHGVHIDVASDVGHWIALDNHIEGLTVAREGNLRARIGELGGVGLFG